MQIQLKRNNFDANGPIPSAKYDSIKGSQKNETWNSKIKTAKETRRRVIIIIIIKQ